MIIVRFAPAHRPADYHPLAARPFAPFIKRMQRTVVKANKFAFSSAADPQADGQEKYENGGNMGAIADSDAVHDIRRILPQHQSALTLLNGKLQNPAVQSFRWLDLACGKGQIISQLEENLSANQRQKLAYLGYDINVEHTRTAERMADALQFASYSFQHGDMSSFNGVVDSGMKFDFITCTNTAHELQPGAFAALFLDALRRLSPKGELFVYDMESLTKPELGALPWRSAEINTLLNAAFEVLGTSFHVEPSGWSHSTCKGWSVTIQREYIDKTDEQIGEAQQQISERLESEIGKILDERLQECNRMLDSFCRFGAETADDATAKLLALYEFWALHRAKEVRQ